MNKVDDTQFGFITPPTSPAKGSSKVSPGLSGIRDSIAPATNSSPKTPPNKIQVWDPSTPGEKIPTPTREKAVLRTPGASHSTDFWEDKDQTQRTIRRAEKSLIKKPVHTIFTTNSPEKDINTIREKGLQPNQYGVIQVPTSNGQVREWAIHPVNNEKTQENRLFPRKGPGMFTMPGFQFLDLLKEHRENQTASSLGEHIRNRVEVVIPKPNKGEIPELPGNGGLDVSSLFQNLPDLDDPKS